MTALDRVHPLLQSLGQTVHWRTVYYPEQFRFGKRFVDVLSTLDEVD